MNRSLFQELIYIMQAEGQAWPSSRWACWTQTNCPPEKEEEPQSLWFLFPRPPEPCGDSVPCLALGWRDQLPNLSRGRMVQNVFNLIVVSALLQYSALWESGLEQLELNCPSGAKRDGICQISIYEHRSRVAEVIWYGDSCIVPSRVHHSGSEAEMGKIHCICQYC